MLTLRRAALTLAALVAALSGPPASAQAQGRLTGVVRDATGAPLPGVTVTVTNAASGAVRRVTTATAGTFSATVAPGAYTVTASLRGFGKQSKTEVRVTGTPVTADFSLEPQREEEVTVTAMLREQAVED